MPSSRTAAMAQEFHEPLRGVITRVERELEDIARQIDHNQSLVARLTWAVGGGDPAYVRAMQDADVISQKLVGIADFLATVASAVSADFTVETKQATGKLRLAELKRKIGSGSHDAGQSGPHEAGDFDLF